VKMKVNAARIGEEEEKKHRTGDRERNTFTDMYCFRFYLYDARYDDPLRLPTSLASERNVSHTNTNDSYASRRHVASTRRRWRRWRC